MALNAYATPCFSFWLSEMQGWRSWKREALPVLYFDSPLTAQAHFRVTAPAPHRIAGADLRATALSKVSLTSPHMGRKETSVGLHQFPRVHVLATLIHDSEK